MKQRATFNGYVHTIAESHPLQTNITFVLTDFQPNSNNEAVPRSEADNIIRTAINMPVKINFDGVSETGHNRATPIGTITSAEIATVDDNEVIIATARLWKKEYPEIDEYLRTATAENKRVGTSWELYYESSERQENISWLQGIVMAATAIVKVPAYGNRTPILSVAEQNELDRIKQLIIDLVTEFEQVEDFDQAFAALQKEVAAKKTKKKVYSQHMDELEEKLKELEEKLATAEKAITDVTAERDALLNEKAEAEKRTARERRVAERVAILTEAGAEVGDEHADLLAEASDEVFTFFVKALSKPKPTQAEDRTQKPRVPATTGGQTVSIDAAAEALNKLFGVK